MLRDTLLSALLAAYSAGTPDTEALSEATVILGNEDEVQPDLLLRMRPEVGGATSDDYDIYINGAPELVCEVAYSSRAIDLHLKRKRYAKAGVREYFVLCLQPKQIHWVSSMAILSSRMRPTYFVRESSRDCGSTGKGY